MKILIWGEIKPGGPYDVFRRLDYCKIYKELLDSYHATGMNVGNKVWIQGIISSLATEDNELFFYNPNESWDIINEKYDKIVYSAANMFSRNYKELIGNVATLFKKSRIPIYVISIGAQAVDYSEINDLTKEIGDEVRNFVNSIYLSGGEIACRGYFTKEFLDNVCQNTAVVTGCPSLFQNGRDLQIEKVGEKINPIFNGVVKLTPKLSIAFPNGIYIDQDEWLKYTYDPDFYFGWNRRDMLMDLIQETNFYSAKLFLSGKIKIFYDMPEWRNFIMNGRYNFSIGSRIHGNIMSLLSGIPAMVCATDTRTREMAEFFNIPYYISTTYKKINVHELYEKCDYAKFNKSFAKIFDEYEKFLIKCELVRNVNQNNIFWNKKNPLNSEVFIEARKEMLNILENSSVFRKFHYIIVPFIRKDKKNNGNNCINLDKEIKEGY